MKFLVLNRESIERYDKIALYQELIKKPHIVISICDPEMEFANLPEVSSRLDCLFLRFPDFDRQFPGYKYNHLIFNENHAKRILNFFNNYKYQAELTICQCEAGISRSAGIASALAKSIYQDDSYFFKYYLPNRLVYKTILNEAFKNE